ncbi:MAG: N-formylglutamate amidohydrolase [Pseudomonadota bacterium]
MIAADEGPTVEFHNLDGKGDIVLICEHANNRLPRSLGDLGLDAEALSSHIAWDPGAADVAKLMATALDAPLVLQRFSRLVYDCNRPPEAESAIPVRSEVFDIPGNVGLTTAGRQERVDAIYRPFRAAVASVLDHRIGGGVAPLVVTIHSFTPVYHGQRRSVELGLLHDVDRTLADVMLNATAGWTDLVVRRNEPYGPDDGVTHTLQVDAIARGLKNVMIEVRSDLIATPAEQEAMAARLSDLVKEALRRLAPAAT